MSFVGGVIYLQKSDGNGTSVWLSQPALIHFHHPTANVAPREPMAPHFSGEPFKKGHLGLMMSLFWLGSFGSHSECLKGVGFPDVGCLSMPNVLVSFRVLEFWKCTGASKGNICYTRQMCFFQRYLIALISPSHAFHTAIHRMGVVSNVHFQQPPVWFFCCFQFELPKTLP